MAGQSDEATLVTYLTLNALFLLVVAAVVAVAAFRMRGRGFGWPAVAITAAAVLLLTAVFDNVMIGVGLVGYDPDRISGLRIGVAPVEDFAYALAAVLLLPALWHLTARPRGNGPEHRTPDEASTRNRNERGPA